MGTLINLASFEVLAYVIGGTYISVFLIYAASKTFFSSNFQDISLYYYCFILLFIVKVRAFHKSVTTKKDEQYGLSCGTNMEVKGCVFKNPSGKPFNIWDGAS